MPFLTGKSHFPKVLLLPKPLPKVNISELSTKNGLIFAFLQYSY